MGMIMERIAYNRLLPIAKSGSGLSQCQYGFLRGHSTVNALSTLVSLALNSGGYCLVLAPVGVTSFHKNCFSGKTLWDRVDEGTKKYIVTEMVPQGLLGHFV